MIAAITGKEDAALMRALLAAREPHLMSPYSELACEITMAATSPRRTSG